MTVRLIPRIETWPAVVAFAQTSGGKALLLACFAGEAIVFGYFRHGLPWIELTLVLACTSFVPSRREMIVLAGTAWLWLAHSPFQWFAVRAVAGREGVAAGIDWNLLHLGALAAGLLFCAGYYAAARKWPKNGPLRRPVASLVGLYIGLAFAAFYLPMSPLVRTLFWAFLIVVGRQLWFLGYSLLDRASDKARPFAIQLGHYSPFWGSSHTPFPKGAAMLRKIEARCPEDLAISQIKGLKLFAWVLLIVVLHRVMDTLVHGREGQLAEALAAGFGAPVTLALPRFEAVLASFTTGAMPPLVVAWASLMSSFLESLLNLAIWGGAIIAPCRLAGYRALRNTWRPLTAPSVAEFWNRYYYYYKELLVDFFFYPTFFRYFRKHPRLRRFAATLAAASFGNLVFHYLSDARNLAIQGPLEAAVSLQVFAAYALILGVAIGVSQLRRARRGNHPSTFLGKVRARVVVIGFYSLIHIFYVSAPSVTLSQHFELLFAMLGFRG